MKVSFNLDDSLPPNQVNVIIQAAQLTPQVTALLTQLTQLEQRPHTLPVTVDDQTILVPDAAIVAVEVFGTNLTIHTLTQDYTVRGTLKKTMTKLDATVFWQINRSVVINLDHLNRLEAAFSGNLLAKMSNGLKLTVSRGYVADLKKQLGM